MSFIFRAVTQSEQERQSGVVVVRDPHDEQHSHTRRTWWTIGVAAAVALNLVALALALSTRHADVVQRAPADTPAKTVAALTPPRDVASIAPAVSAPATRPIAPPATRSPAPAPTARHAAPRTPPPAARDRSAAVTRPTAAPPSVAPVPAPSRVADAAPRMPPRAADTKPALAPTASSTAASTTTGETGADEAALDALKLQVLVYSDVPTQRMVFINGRKYVEGDQVEGRFALDRITPEGALVTYQGRQHLLREHGGG